MTTEEKKAVLEARGFTFLTLFRCVCPKRGAMFLYDSIEECVDRAWRSDQIDIMRQKKK
jgi:hypothetical protein